VPVKSERKNYRTETYITMTSNRGKRSDTVRSANNRVLDTRTTSANLLNYKSRLANLISATTVLQGDNTRVKRYYDLHYSCWLANNPPFEALDYRFDVTGDIPFLSLFVPQSTNASLVTQADSRAMIAFSKQVRKKTQNWQSGVFTGELLETARLLASPVKRLREEVGNLVSDALRKKAKHKKSTAKTRRAAVADTWLTWSFGVKPLISDANDAALAFRALASGRCIDSIRFTGIGEADGSLSYPNGLSFEGVNLGPGVPSSLIGRVRYTDKCMVIYRGAMKNSNPSGEMPLPMRFGLDLSSVVPTTWELIPWSFMVDYFTNVGDALDAWSMRFLNFAWMNRTVRNSRTSDVEGFQNSIAISTSQGRKSTCVGRPPSALYATVDRNIATNLFMPSLALKIPGFPSTKWVNIAALANGIAAVKSR